MTTDIAAIGLPDGIHAAILTRRDKVTGEMVSRGVVWADRTYSACVTCGHPVPRTPDCPVTLNEGDARGTQFMENTQQHCMIGGSCGTWQSVLWAECGTSEDGIAAAAAELAQARGVAADSARDKLTARLREQLSGALAAFRDPYSGSLGITTGSDTQPGIYFDESNSGQWVAWDFDPEDDSETVTVYASDLA